jgi:hypothetical protein
MKQKYLILCAIKNPHASEDTRGLFIAYINPKTITKRSQVMARLYNGSKNQWAA